MPLKALTAHLDPIVTIGLCILLFFVGIDIGRNKNLIRELKEHGWRMLALPLSVALGSIVGSILVGLLLRIPLNFSGAIGAGFGWYTLSAVILTKLDAQMGALAFLTNVFREVMAMILIPLIAEKMGKVVAIAPGGATSMDTTLPIITRSAGPEYAVMAFVSGAVLSALVPFLVPLMVSIL